MVLDYRQGTHLTGGEATTVRVAVFLLPLPVIPLLVVALPLPFSLSLPLSFALPLALSVALPVPLSVLAGRAVVVASGRGGAAVTALVPSLGAGAALVHARPLRSFIAEIQTKSCYLKAIK